MNSKRATAAKLQGIAAKFRAPSPAAPADPDSAAQVDAAMRSALERIARVVVPGSYIHKICTHALAGQTYRPPADAPGDE